MELTAMRIKKYGHSCVLVEENDTKALFDPGVFSKEQLLSALDDIDDLDYLVITHNHTDHFDIEAVAAIAKRWPEVRLAANEQTRRQLEDLNLGEADEACQPFEAPHEALPHGDAPKNTGWHFGEFSHPGDSLSFNETRSILALPYVAPWGSTTQAVELARQLKPKIVVPIHDWHLSPEARKWYGGLLARSLSETGIEFIDLPLGQAVTIDA